MSSSVSKSTHKGALIFMHGLGDTPRGWSSLQHQLPSLKPRLKDIRYVFPPSPTIPITINGGAKMPGWFDLYDWPIGVGSKDDPVGLLRSVQQVREEVERLGTEEGIPADKIVVGGFSQGGAVALLACYHQQNDGVQHKFAGCAGLSAWLTLPKEVAAIGKDTDAEDPRKKIPLFWGHGTYDDKVLFEQQQFGLEKLSNEFGLDWGLVTSTQYPMGHQSCEDEISSLAEFIDNALFGEKGAKPEL